MGSNGARKTHNLRLARYPHMLPVETNETDKLIQHCPLNDKTTERQFYQGHDRTGEKSGVFSGYVND